MTKTKIALAAVLFAATSSAALAQGYYDPNLANRYPGYPTPRHLANTAMLKCAATCRRQAAKGSVCITVA